MDKNLKLQNKYDRAYVRVNVTNNSALKYNGECVKYICGQPDSKGTFMCQYLLMILHIVWLG